MPTRRDAVAALVDEPGADPELVAAATNVVAAFGGTAEYDQFLARFRCAATPQEQLRYLYALAEFPDGRARPAHVRIGNERRGADQNAPFLLARCIASRWQGEMAWEFVRRHWAEANERFPGSTIVRMIDPVKMLTGHDVVADVQSFFSEHPIPQAAKTLDQVLERQRVNAAMFAREQARLTEALRS